MSSTNTTTTTTTAVAAVAAVAGRQPNISISISSSNSSSGPNKTATKRRGGGNLKSTGLDCDDEEKPRKKKIKCMPEPEEEDEVVVEVKRLYVYPNPMKLLGDCCIVELEEQILQLKKKQSRSSSNDVLDPNKPLRDCSLEELYEQIEIQNEKQTSQVWPNPNKTVGSCYIQELEEQLIKVKQQQQIATAKQPQCYLPLLADNLFGNNVLDYLVPIDIARVLMVPEIVKLYRLSGYVCRIHANKFVHPTQWKTTLATVHTRHHDNGKPAIVDGQYYDQYKQYVEWKIQYGIAPYPHSCVVCERSRRAKEQCRDGCKRAMSWDDLFTCNVCDRRLCCRCSDKFEYQGNPKSGICDDCVDGERAAGKQIRSRWTRI